jgi:hypothetical protein
LQYQKSRFTILNIIAGFDAADGIMAEEADDERQNNGSIDIGKLSPPRSAVKNTFEKTIAVRNNVDTSRPSSGNKGIQRPRSSRRPPSRTLRDRLSVIRQDSRFYNLNLQLGFLALFYK